MAFIIQTGRCKLDPAACVKLVEAWRGLLGGFVSDCSERARHVLQTAPPSKLALLGLSTDITDEYGRGWLTPPHVSPSLCLAALLLEHTTPIRSLPLRLWEQLSLADRQLGLAAGMARNLAHGRPLAEWMGTFSGVRCGSLEPTAAHLGGWARGKRLRAALDLLQPLNSNQDHDALRHWLMQFGDEDWILTNPVW